MTDINLVNNYGWHFGSLIGFSHPFFTLNIHTMIHTWLIMCVMLICAVIMRYCLSNNDSLLHSIIIDAAQSLTKMLEQSMGICIPVHFYFTGALFLFISFCNLAPLIPGLDEPTQDINTTFALGIVSFLYIQMSAIQKLGFLPYIKGEFLTPVFLLPLHIIGKIASILSISLRLFGNIFGGSIICKIYFSAIKYIVLSNFITIILQLLLSSIMTIIITMFFTVIEGLLQAFVFTMLTVTYLAIALHDDQSH